MFIRLSSPITAKKKDLTARQKMQNWENLKKPFSKKLGDSFVDPNPELKIAFKKLKINYDHLL